MKIVIGSAFRNSASRLERYFAQVDALRVHAGPRHSVRVIAVEGDSVDATATALSYMALKYRIDLELVECSHGGPVFSSTEHPERLQALSKVGNCILEHVRADDDVLVYVESDLLWGPHTIGTLIDIASERRHGFDVAAPLVFAGPHFYDIFAFRKNGQRFSPFRPFHPLLSPQGMTEVDSVGSCLVMRSEVAQKVRIPRGEVLIGWCNEARRQGYRIGVHAEFAISHP